MSDTDTYIRIANVIALVLGGGGFVALLTFLNRNKELNITQHGSDREADRVDFNTVLAEVKAQRDEAWARNKDCDARMQAMEAEIQGLRLARDLDPFPNWVVDLSGEYLYVNREFEKGFLEPAGQTYRDVVGKRHEDVWPPKFCQTLHLLDTEARSRPDGTARAKTTVEVPILGDVQMTVHKFPIRFKPSGIIVAYAGFITNIEPVQELIGGRA